MVSELLIDIDLNIADLPLFGLDVVQVDIEICGLALALALHAEDCLHVGCSTIPIGEIHSGNRKIPQSPKQSSRS